MPFTGDVSAAKRGNQFVLIGTPVGHSLSPVMHNAVYGAAKVDWYYHAIDCPTEQEALHQIDLVRTGTYRGMNITMPYKRLALSCADFADPSAAAAGGANVLVRRGFDLCAYNTDGYGAVGAIERLTGIDYRNKRACVCGTGPTAMAIACALATKNMREIVIFSRNIEKAQAAVEHLETCLEEAPSHHFTIAEYEDAWRHIPQAAVIIDATPRGMQPDDEAIIDPCLFHEGQVVFDVVYGHGLTKLVKGAREQGATALDGTEMLVEQAALAIEIWQDVLGYDFAIDRALMRGPRMQGVQQQEEDDL